jgi:hypothetical protein
VPRGTTGVELALWKVSQSLKSLSKQKREGETNQALQMVTVEDRRGRVTV